LKGLLACLALIGLPSACPIILSAVAPEAGK